MPSEIKVYVVRKRVANNQHSSTTQCEQQLRKLFYMSLSCLTITPSKPQKKRYLVVRVRSCDRSLYDGNINKSLRWDRNTYCHNPGEEQWRREGHIVTTWTLSLLFIAIISPVFLLHLVIPIQGEYVLRYVFAPGQQESSWWLLLQTQSGEQQRIRLYRHPVHQFGESRKHRGDGRVAGIIWGTATTTTTHADV